MSLLYMRPFCCPCVVMHAQFVQCVYAKILHLACAHVVPKALRSFFFQIYTVYLGCIGVHIGPSPMLGNILELRYELKLQNRSIIGIGICTCGR